MWRILRLFYSRETLADIFLLGVAIGLVEKGILEVAGMGMPAFSLKGRMIYRFLCWTGFKPTAEEHNDFYDRCFTAGDEIEKGDGDGPVR